MILREEDGRERVTTDEERVARGAEQRSGCADKKVEQWQEFYSSSNSSSSRFVERVTRCL